MSKPDSITIRLKAVEIAAQKQHPTYGIGDVLFDAKALYDFIKEGKIIEPENAEGE